MLCWIYNVLINYVLLFNIHRQSQLWTRSSWCFPFPMTAKFYRKLTFMILKIERNKAIGSFVLLVFYKTFPYYSVTLHLKTCSILTEEKLWRGNAQVKFELIETFLVYFLIGCLSLIYSKICLVSYYFMSNYFKNTSKSSLQHIRDSQHVIRI